MSRIIIGLAGKKGSGKDTLASVLVEKHGFSRLAFGDYLKDIITQCLDVPSYSLFTERLKDRPFDNPIKFTEEHFTRLLKALDDYDCGFRDESFRAMVQTFLTTEFTTPRQIMQFVGTDIVRQFFDEDTWVKMLKKDLDEQISSKIVITDCRMTNERDLVRSLGGKLGLVVRDNSINKDDTHLSENNLGEVDEYDYIFTNNSEITSFQHEIDLWATLKYS